MCWKNNENYENGANLPRRWYPVEWCGRVWLLDGVRKSFWAALNEPPCHMRCNNEKKYPFLISMSAGYSFEWSSTSIVLFYVPSFQNWQERFRRALWCSTCRISVDGLPIKIVVVAFDILFLLWCLWQIRGKSYFFPGHGPQLRPADREVIDGGNTEGCVIGVSHEGRYLW